eukprot:CAMPEP_0178816320 /NCGR_PEP_ID=MMETSP0746-20121128/1286_1 /TAXON_ID=913974 /ORGANISM="Nitzschia punctata, Strain CCMP561" /LENGTH=171 /DNA_ID=CAMNT_0020477331 /DNA_START=282 /DNA_END=798 /DNA_ORIENTATION=-
MPGSSLFGIVCVPIETRFLWRVKRPSIEEPGIPPPPPIPRSPPSLEGSFGDQLSVKEDGPQRPVDWLVPVSPVNDNVLKPDSRLTSFVDPAAPTDPNKLSIILESSVFGAAVPDAVAPAEKGEGVERLVPGNDEELVPGSGGAAYDWAIAAAVVVAVVVDNDAIVPPQPLY